MYFVLCCQVEFSATGRSLVQGSPTECGVSKYDCKASILGDPGPLEAVASKKKLFIYLVSELTRSFRPSFLCLYVREFRLDISVTRCVMFLPRAIMNTV